jgi:predicted PurR-regulated permease PerM
MLRGAAIFFGLYFFLRMLWTTRSILITVFLGIIVGLAISAGVDFVRRRWKIKRGIVATVILLLVLGALGGLGALMAPIIRDQTQQLQQRLPEVVDTLEQWLGSRSTTGALAQPEPEPVADPGTPTPEQTGPPEAKQERPDSTGPPQQESQQQSSQPQQTSREGQEGLSQQQASGQNPQGEALDPSAQQGQQEEAAAPAQRLREQLSQQLGGLLQYLFPFVSGTAAAVTGLILILFIALYVASDPGLYRRGVLHLFPHRMRDRAAEVMEEMGTALRRWLVARLLAMIAIGLITTGALLLLGVQSAVVLGILAGLLEFIPIFGPIMAAIPAIGLAFADSPQKALSVAIAFVIIQQIEGNIVTPLLLKNRVEVPPALTIISVATLGLLFGFLGLLVAEPILVAAMVAVKMLWVEDVVGDDVGGAGEG